MNHGIKISLSSIYLQGYDSLNNVNVVKANLALQWHCLVKGRDSIDHGNVAFRHLDGGGMYLTWEGNRLFASNLLERTKLLPSTEQLMMVHIGSV